MELGCWVQALKCGQVEFINKDLFNNLQLGQHHLQLVSPLLPKLVPVYVT